MNDFPAVSELIPHARQMLLLAHVVSHDAVGTRCAALPDDAALFRDESGRVPTWLAVEYMAQCIATHGGLIGHSRGEGPRVGFLVGARGIVHHRSHFVPGEEIVVEACPRRSTAGLFDFACRLEGQGGVPIAEGRVQCFVQEGLEGLRRLGWKEKLP